MALRMKALLLGILPSKSANSASTLKATTFVFSGLGAIVTPPAAREYLDPPSSYGRFQLIASDRDAAADGVRTAVTRI
jgi:hypothetical protein